MLHGNIYIHWSSWMKVHGYTLLRYQKHVQINLASDKSNTHYREINYFTRALNVVTFTNGGHGVVIASC